MYVVNNNLNVVLVCQFDEFVVKYLEKPTYLIGKQRLIFRFLVHVLDVQCYQSLGVLESDSDQDVLLSSNKDIGRDILARFPGHFGEFCGLLQNIQNAREDFLSSVRGN